jgi:hypothetical protein
MGEAVPEPLLFVPRKSSRKNPELDGPPEAFFAAATGDAMFALL